MTGFVADFRHALRVYGTTPFASAIAVIALAVAMAFVSAFLSLWSDLAFTGHSGFERSDELVTVGFASQYGVGGLMEPQIAEYNATTTTLAGVAGIDRSFSPAFDQAGERTGLRTELVTVAYFDVLQPRLQLGRGFDASDHRTDAEAVVVISHDFWQRHFDGRADVIGESISVVQSRLVAYPGGPVNEPEPRFEDREHRFRVVGVMDEAMHGTFERQAPTLLWLPYERMAPDVASPGTFVSFPAVGRLVDGTSLARVQTELDTRYSPENAEFRSVNPFTTDRLTVVTGVGTSPEMLREGRQQVGLFLAGTVLLAVVAACNASLFLLSRAPARRRELGIRIALGATSRRLTRQLASEATLLVAAAAALGILIGLWFAALLRELPVFANVQWRELPLLDWRVLMMLVGLTAVLGCVVALAPLLGLRRQGIAAAARRVSARAGWGQRTAGTVQVCIAAVVSAVAIALAWQLVVYAGADRGFTLDDISVVRISGSTLGREQALGREELATIRARRVENFAALPGVQAVALASQVPGEAVSVRRTPAINLPGFELPDEGIWLGGLEIDANFIELLGLELVHGRSFDAADSFPVIVNETLARELWGRTDVVGESFGTSIVVGVMRDVSFGHPAETIPPIRFTPVGLVYDVLVRSALAPNELRALVQQQIDSGVLDVEIDGVERVQDVWNAQFSADHARIRLSASAAVLILLLAAFGFYGTQRYLVAAGRREYAVRAAIGAGPRMLGRLVLARGLLLGLPGLVFGSLLAWIAVAWLRGDFVTVAVSAFGVVAVVALVLLALVLAATWGPSRQARATAPAPLLNEN